MRRGPSPGGLPLRGGEPSCQPRAPTKSGLPGRRVTPIRCPMVDAPDTSTSALDRIDAAIRRIEAANAARATSGAAIARRHAALKARMAEAVAALDDVIARGSAG